MTFVGTALSLTALALAEAPTVAPQTIAAEWAAVSALEPSGGAGSVQSSGSLAPQRRTAVAFLCPERWYGGLAGTDRPDPEMCYPGPGATPAYPPADAEEPCIAGYVRSSTWCVQNPEAITTSGGPASASPVSCPRPTSTTANAGSVLGGLLGSRRGNAQAGAALGGMLGNAVSGQASSSNCP